MFKEVLSVFCRGGHFPPVGNSFTLGEKTVKQTCCTTLIVSLCLAFGGFVSQASAQGLPQFVAVVDVAQLIKEHPEFRSKQETLQKEVQGEEAKFRARQEAIVAKDKALQNTGIKAGTPEHQKAIDEIASDYADFEKDAKSMQRKFALKNSQIMFDTYQDIKKVIGEFAKARKIAQVTDYRMFDPNPAEPQSVAEDMDQKLVWFDPQLDITDLVINQLYAARGLQRPAKSDVTNSNAARSVAQPQQAAPNSAVANPASVGGQAPVTSQPLR
jgi:Skp family chaperone for outer membrane proteins